MSKVKKPSTKGRTLAVLLKAERNKTREEIAKSVEQIPVWRMCAMDVANHIRSQKEPV